MWSYETGTNEKYNLFLYLSVAKRPEVLKSLYFSSLLYCTTYWRLVSILYQVWVSEWVLFTPRICSFGPGLTVYYFGERILANRWKTACGQTLWLVGEIPQGKTGGGGREGRYDIILQLVKNPLNRCKTPNGGKYGKGGKDQRDDVLAHLLLCPKSRGGSRIGGRNDWPGEKPLGKVAPVPSIKTMEEIAQVEVKVPGSHIASCHLCCHRPGVGAKSNGWLNWRGWRGQRGSCQSCRMKRMWTSLSNQRWSIGGEWGWLEVSGMARRWLRSVGGMWC